jgi:hypothetical protein
MVQRLDLVGMANIRAAPTRINTKHPDIQDEISSFVVKAIGVIRSRIRAASSGVFLALSLMAESTA